MTLSVIRKASQAPECSNLFERIAGVSTCGSQASPSRYETICNFLVAASNIGGLVCCVGVVFRGR